MDNYTVWVGGTEVVDHLVGKAEADDIAARYIADGYDDVCVELVKK